MQETPDTSISESIPKWSVQKVVLVVASSLGGTIVLIFVIGLLLILSSPLEATALRLTYLRNIVFIILALEGVTIVGSLALLVIQITRLINLLSREVRPMLASTRSVVDSAKGTVEFVGDTVAQPVVQAGGILSGARVVMRDIGGIRRAIEHRDGVTGNSPNAD